MSCYYRIHMAHLRNRYLSPLFQNSMKLSPLVGISGHRQVGKTTFLESHCSSYHVVDTQAELRAAQDNPEKYLKDRAGKAVALDECQAAPALFPELKEWVRKHRAPGQFVLSGSIRFTSQEAIRESLTGRIVHLELLPMTISEQEELPLSRFLIQFAHSRNTDRFPKDHPIDTRRARRIQSRIARAPFLGGLPGACFLRDQKQRVARIQQQLMTILDRDLRLVQEIRTPLFEIQGLVRTLAELQGTPFHYTLLREKTGLSTPTIKKIISALESVFLIRFLPIRGSTTGPTWYFEDQGESSALCPVEPNSDQTRIHTCFTNLRAQLHYHPNLSYECFQYRTRGGAYIPLAYQFEEQTLGILPIGDLSSVKSHSGSIQSFLAAYSGSKILILHTEDSHTCYPLSARVLAAPLAGVL